MAPSILGCAGNHVLHIVSVTRAVHVSVVTVFGFVFDVCGIDGNAAGLFFRRAVDLVVTLGFATEFLRQDRGDRSGQGGLAVVNVTDGANVDVRFGPFELFPSHFAKFLNKERM